MSHFSVLVLGDDVEDLLDPYYEGKETEGTWEVEARTPDEFWAANGWVTDGLLKPGYTMVQLMEVIRDQWPHETDQWRINSDGQLEHLYTGNPDGKWDWWVIGGRWAGSLLLKPGAKGVLGEDRWSSPKVEPGWVDQARKVDVDLDRMRELAKEAAAKRWEGYEAIIAKHGPLPDEFWRKLNIKDEQFKAARDAYWAHPAVMALREKGLVDFLSWPGEEFGADKEGYLQRAELSAFGGYAVLSGDIWLEPGRMGWFGMSSATGDDELEYLRKANQLIDTAPEDTLFTIVDCHT